MVCSRGSLVSIMVYDGSPVSVGYASSLSAETPQQPLRIRSLCLATLES